MQQVTWALAVCAVTGMVVSGWYLFRQAEGTVVARDWAVCQSCKKGPLPC